MASIIYDTIEPSLPGTIKVEPVTERFVLKQNDRQVILDTCYRFGFPGFSEAVYYRTYSRLQDGAKELFPDTVLRVVEGVMSIRKNWYVKHGIEWNEDYWSTYAVRFGVSMIKMHFLPPGRGLWACGTDYCYTRGSAALNNCGFVSTGYDSNFIDAAIWMMDALMCGCGIGFDTEWQDSSQVCLPGCVDCRFQNAGQTPIVPSCNCLKTIYVIHDSREGWIKSLYLLLLSYFTPGSNVMLFDYTLVRPRGKQINGFGGTSSGYEPLKVLHDEVRAYMECFVNCRDDPENLYTYIYKLTAGNDYVTPKIKKVEQFTDYCIQKLEGYPVELPIDIATYVNVTPEQFKSSSVEQLIKWLSDWNKTYDCTRLIADVFNSIGKCVVAGNVRRSSEIILGRPDDFTFLNLKNYKLNPEREAIGWMSNNTVVLKQTEDFEYLPMIAKRMRDNGEPGIYNQINTQRYGRVGRWEPIGREYEHDKAIGLNPCVTGDTLVTTDKGLKSVRELIGTQFVALIQGECYTSTTDGFWSSGVRLVYQLTLENGATLKATKNHKIQILNGTDYYMVELGELKLGADVVIGNNWLHTYVPDTTDDEMTRGFKSGAELGSIPLDQSLEFNLGFCIGLSQSKAYIDVINRVIFSVSSLDTSRNLQQLLLSIGIFSHITPENNLSIAGPEYVKYQNLLRFKKAPNYTKLTSKVVSIELIDSEEVFDCSIPGPNVFTANGMIVANCGEQPLESFELCCLSEWFPSRAQTYADKLEAVEMATFYASTISLLPSHLTRTNSIIARNHRIGVSISGIAEQYDTVGYTQMTKEFRKLYRHVREINKRLADEAGVCESIRVTTVKPSGTISQLVGVPSGNHWPCFDYSNRRVRISDNDQLVPILKDAGYQCEPDLFIPKTLVFTFPIDQSGGGKVRSATDVSIWEQAMQEASLQREWSDNCVSQTLYFNPETEGPILELVLAQITPLVKCLSVLPHTPEGVYKQAPYERISREQYLESLTNIKAINWAKFTSDAETEKGCDSDVCVRR